MSRSAIIHISDTEFGEFDRVQSSSRQDGYALCVERFAEDVSAILAQEQVPSDRVGLVVTGDIAYYGAREEYETALRVVNSMTDRLHIGRERIAIVPGNHDVNWPACKEAFDASGKSNHKDAESLAEKHLHFSRFFRELLGKEFPGPGSAFAFPGFLPMGFALVGIDSTLPCTFDETDNYGRVLDSTAAKAGVLLRGLKESAETGIDDATIGIVALHHCATPQADRHADDNSYLHEAEDARSFLTEAGFELFICGHEHRQGSSGDLRTGGKVLTTGSFGLGIGKLVERYEGDQRIPTNRYQILLLKDDAVNMECVLRRLEPPGNASSVWGPDKEQGPERFIFMPRLQPFSAAGEPEVRFVIGTPAAFDRKERTFAVEVALEGAKDSLERIRKVTYSASAGTKRESTNARERFRTQLEMSDSTDRVLGVELTMRDGPPIRREVQLPPLPS